MHDCIIILIKLYYDQNYLNNNEFLIISGFSDSSLRMCSTIILSSYLIIHRVTSSINIKHEKNLLRHIERNPQKINPRL